MFSIHLEDRGLASVFEPVANDEQVAAHVLSALFLVIVGQRLDVTDLVCGFPDPYSRVFDGLGVS